MHLLSMQAYLDDGRAPRIGCSQDDDLFGLWPQRRRRWTALTELPTGPVEDGVLVGGRPLLAWSTPQRNRVRIDPWPKISFR